VAADERDLVAGAPAQGEEVSAAAAGCRGEGGHGCSETKWIVPSKKEL
jgi:hypothetical protein